MQSTCKLCQSFAASQFETAAERELPGSDTFTRDPDICDACLSQDFTPPRFGAVEGFCLLMGWLVGFVVSTVLVSLGFVPVPSSPVLSVFILAPGVAAVTGGMLWLLLRLYVRIRVGSVPQGPKEREVDAERFYWLAVWGSLTSRSRWRRRMLKNAQAMGFSDHRRLSDPRLRDGV
jgi:hypothetical protein